MLCSNENNAVETTGSDSEKGENSWSRLEEYQRKDEG